MKFGHFCLPSYYPDVYPGVAEHMRWLLDFMASSEDLGFDAVWANEHHFHAYGGHVPSPPVLLAALAQKTKRVRLGTSIVTLPLHNPIEIAEQMAMVDLMSNGRLEFGVGRGFVIHDHEIFGVPLDDSQSRTTEGLEVILKAWTGKPFSHEGKHFHIKNLEVWPKPQQEPHPPVWIACTGTPSSFEWTGSQGYNLLTVAYLRPLPKLAELIKLFQDAWQAAGHDPASAEICTHYQIVVDEDGAAARARAEQAVRRYGGLLGESIRQAQNVNAALAASAQSEVHVDKLIDEGRLVAGTPDECAAILERAIDELGVTIVDGNFLFGGISYEDAQRSLRLFGTEVIPKLRGRLPAWKAQPAGARP